MTDDPSAIEVAGQQRTALLVMLHYDETDTPCLSAKHLAERSDLPLAAARMAGRELVKLGLAKCETGLVTDDGDFYGSGWCLSDDGLAVRKHLETNDDAG